MSVILCKREQVSHPYFLEVLGIHVYTSQELCYVIFHHPLLAMEDFMNPSLIEFIRNELDMGFTALKMERRMKGGENSDETLLLFLKECNYYTSGEINQLRQKISSFRKLPPLEYAKRKVDYLFDFKQYGKAIAGYEKILSEWILGFRDEYGIIWERALPEYSSSKMLWKLLNMHMRKQKMGRFWKRSTI